MSGIFEDVQTACAHLSSVPVSHAMPLCRINTGKSKEVSLLSGALCCCPACECKCGLPIWYLGLVVMFSLTGSSSGMLHPCSMDLQLQCLHTGFHSSLFLPVIAQSKDYL